MSESIEQSKRKEIVIDYFDDGDNLGWGKILNDTISEKDFPHGTFIILPPYGCVCVSEDNVSYLLIDDSSLVYNSISDKDYQSLPNIFSIEALDALCKAKLSIDIIIDGKPAVAKYDIKDLEYHEYRTLSKKTFDGVTIGGPPIVKLFDLDISNVPLDRYSSILLDSFVEPGFVVTTLGDNKVILREDGNRATWIIYGSCVVYIGYTHLINDSKVCRVTKDELIFCDDQGTLCIPYTEL